MAAMPRQRGEGDAYLAARRGFLRGTRPWLGPQGHLLGMQGQGSIPGAAGEGPCREEALR